MTKSEIEQNAEKYADDYATPDLDCVMRTHIFECAKTSYINGALSRQPEIDEAREIIKEWQKKVCKELSDSCCPSCECCLFGEIKARAKKFLGE